MTLVLVTIAIVVAASLTLACQSDQARAERARPPEVRDAAGGATVRAKRPNSSWQHLP
jgi:hypothetical protein